MTVRRRSAVCWLAALGMTAAMFALIFLVLDPQYAVNDDSGILRPFMGFETGEPAHFHIYLHGLLAWPLHWLGLAAPGVAWLSWMQLAFLFLASAVCQKSIMQRFAGAKKPLWLGALFALAFTCAFVLPYATRITFTQTAALLGAAAVLQILSVDHAEASYGAVLRGMGLALVLLVLAYALRQVAALPIACFCGAALLYVAARDDGFGRIKSIKPLVVSVVLAAVVMAGLTGLREWEIDANGARDYLAWQASTEDLMDRYGFEGIPQEELDRVGWSANTAAMVGSQWFFLDESVSTEAFDQLTAYIRATRDMSLSARAGEAAQVLAAFPADNPAVMPSLWLLAAVIVLSAAGAALLPRGGRFRMLGALLLTVLLWKPIGVRKASPSPVRRSCWLPTSVPPRMPRLPLPLTAKASASCAVSSCTWAGIPCPPRMSCSKLIRRLPRSWVTVLWSSVPWTSALTSRFPTWGVRRKRILHWVCVA